MSNSPQMPSAPTPEEPASSGNSNPVDEQQPSPTQDARTWERWIRDIGFGIYILAALGLLFYAMTFQKLGLNWGDLRPYVIGIVALGAVLLILSYGWGWLKQADIGKKTQQIFATIILIFFVCIVAAAAGWVVIFILREAGILSNREINGTQTAYPGPTPSTDNHFDIPLVEVTPELSDTFIIPNYNPPKIDYSAFEIIEDERILDLRRSVDVPAAFMTTRHSPACWRRRIRLKKLHEIDKFVIRYSTSGAGVDAKCDSHKFMTGYAGPGVNTKEPFLMKNFDLIIDIEKEPVGKEFEIRAQATSWNGFTEREEWAGFDARENNQVQRKSFKILFPTRKPYNQVWYRFTDSGRDDEKPRPEHFREYKDKGNRGVFWILEGSGTKLWVETRWTW